MRRITGFAGRKAKALQEAIRMRFGKKDIPQDRKWELIEQFHQAGHRGMDAVFQEMFRAGYLWPGLREDIEKVTKSCKDCLIHNVHRVGVHPLMTVSSEAPMYQVAIDLAGPYPEDQCGMRYILVWVDRFSSYCVLRPLKSKEALETAAMIFFDYL